MRSLFGSILLAAWLSIIPNANAQQKFLKDQIVGTWSLVSYTNTAPDGSVRYLLGEKPKGTVVYDASGRYIFLFVTASRPKWRSSNRLEASNEEIKSAAMGVITQFGTWSINETDKIMTRRIEAALIPNNEGNEAKFTISLSSDDEMRILDGSAVVGGRNEVVLKRVR